MVSVWELRNKTLKEAFVGATALSLEQILARGRFDPGGPLSHWAMGRHAIDYSELAPLLPQRDACEFILSYAKAMAADGWKILFDVRRAVF